MRFAKGHGTENDFVVVLDPDGGHGLTPALAARLCDRRAGVGADGVLRAVRVAALASEGDGTVPGGAGSGARLAGAAGDAPAGAEWFMDYRNADGSVAEMCGNGIRLFARYLARQGLVAGPEFVVATRSGARRVRLEPDGDVTVDMGPVAVLGPGEAIIAGEPCQGLRISVGNPHLACLVDRPLDSFDLTRPPELVPGQFAAGANVELLRLTGPRSLAMRVHERGSGETRSCGTGAVAAAAAAATATGEQGSWQVAVPGGRLAVALGDGAASLTGPAVLVAEGELDQAWLAGA